MKLQTIRALGAALVIGGLITAASAHASVGIKKYSTIVEFDPNTVCIQSASTAYEDSRNRKEGDAGYYGFRRRS